MKREITYYMEEYYPVKIIEDTEEGGFTIYLPDCPGCVTCCERWEDIPATIADAQKEWMEAVTENITPPDPDDEDFDDEISDDEEWYQGEHGETLKYYMNLEYNIRFWMDSSNYYNVALREIPSVSGFGASPEMAMKMLELEKKSWLFCALRDGIEIPLPQQMRSKIINISFN
jgi:predicted RNase H-like HicB family nuclease